MIHPIDKPTRHLFFTGKGGVGKTSLACATAIALADQGRRVLLVSTDPASNLDEVLGVRLAFEPTDVPNVPGLRALNIDPEAAAKAYRERMVGPYRGVLPEAAIASIEEQLSGACTTEIAAFDEFAGMLGDRESTAAYDHIVFDTAPTGHTLRLLQLPAAWSDFLEKGAGGTSCLGPLSGLNVQRALYAKTVAALTDSQLTTIVLVSRPELAALQEADRTRQELSSLGVKNQHFILNGRFIAADRNDSTAVALEQRCSIALQQLPTGLAQLARTELMLLPFPLVGIDSLRLMFKQQSSALPVAAQGTQRLMAPLSLPPFTALVSELEDAGNGVIMVMGKGGVGKTTIAAAIAVALADRGHNVHLSTTDPAGRVQSSLASNVPRLTVSRIDPLAQTLAYRQEVLASTGKQLDPDAYRLLEEELRSPCTEEIAVFRAFADIVAEGKDGFVVLDTAPTGHTLLLLDATEAYHRQVSHTMSDLPESVRQLLPRLRDSAFTRIIVATLPEATPVHEAAQLQRDLRRAEISPYAWVINQCLTPLKISDPVLRVRQAAERQYIDEVHQKHSLQTCFIPWMDIEPISPETLRQLVTEVRQSKTVDTHSSGR